MVARLSATFLRWLFLFGLLSPTVTLAQTATALPETVTQVLKREGVTYTGKYGQAPEIRARGEGPEAAYLRVFVTAATIRIVRFEVQAFLDYDYVKELFPPEPKPGEPPKPGDIKTEKPSWIEQGTGTVSHQDNTITIDASAGVTSLINDKSSFSGKARVDMKFKADLIGADYSTGVGLVVSGNTISSDGNILCEWREDGGGPVLNILQVEGRAWKLLKSQRISTALKPGSYSMSVIYENDTIKVEFNGGVDSVTVPLKLTSTFKAGIWTQRGKIQVTEFSAR